MMKTRILAISIGWVVMSSAVISAQDLSSYREFHLGMTLAAVAHQAGIAPEVRVLHARPELIQELTWQPGSDVRSSPPGESVRKVLFSFYNGQLFRINVSYDWDRTEGLTVDDMVEALSMMYGPATLAATGIGASLARIPTEVVHPDSDRIVARWGDADYSVNLFRPSSASTFALVVFSKRLDALAQSASVDPIRPDQQEAAGRATERKQTLEDEDQARQAKVRLVNKASFRP